MRHLVCLILLFISHPVFALEFKISGLREKMIDDKVFLSSKRVASITVIEPHTNKPVTYLGRPFVEVMSEAFGKNWLEKDEVLFTCVDGYQPSIPVAKFKEFNAWLVWARKDGAPFEIINTLQGNERVKLGPMYLVWDNQNSKELLDDGADDFPYQVVSVDLIRFKDKFPKLAPSPANAIRDNEGFILFRKYCVKCHGIDGEGGQKGPDLKKSDAFTRLSNEQLRRWVLDPQKSKPGTAMPPFAPHLPEREHKLDQILSYLKGKRSE